MNNFYTYAYLREDRTPYYIGKGSGKRVYVRQGRTVLIPKDRNRIILLKQNLTEEEAFRHEKYMIAVFGRKDLGTGILRNLTDGGEGTSGIIAWNIGGKCSEEWKKKVSESKKGKARDKETREKISKSLTKLTHEERRENYRKYQREYKQKQRENQKGS